MRARIVGRQPKAAWSLARWRNLSTLKAGFSRADAPHTRALLAVPCVCSGMRRKRGPVDRVCGPGGEWERGKTKGTSLQERKCRKKEGRRKAVTEPSWLLITGI